jgi:hypothetical protein
MPRAVMAMSSRYPQLLWALARIFRENAALAPPRFARVMLNDGETRAVFINLKPRLGFA